MMQNNFLLENAVTLFDIVISRNCLLEIYTAAAIWHDSGKSICLLESYCCLPLWKTNRSDCLIKSKQ